MFCKTYCSKQNYITELCVAYLNVKFVVIVNGNTTSFDAVVCVSSCHGPGVVIVIVPPVYHSGNVCGVSYK